MDTVIGADAAKLAGLQIDLLQKIRSGQVTLDHLEWFSKLTKGERERFCNGAHTVGKSRIITIDRAAPFDPVKLLGQNWTIDEQDERSLALKQVDLTSIRLVHMLGKNESWIEGEERFRRLNNVGYIRLDAKIFQTLWEDQALIPASWKKKTNGSTTSILFDGTVLRSPWGYGSRRHVLSLYWSINRWHWSHFWLGDDYLVYFLSAVLGI